MRVIGGSARGRRLASPEGRSVRPTSDRVRQSLFDLLGQRCDGLNVLDLYAGTGALGIEALSRGAARATFVERDPKVLRLLEENLRALGFSERSRALRRDASLGASGRFDLVFLDPPYALGVAGPLQGLLGAREFSLAPEGRVVVEHDRGEVAPAALGGLVRYDQRDYGRTRLSLYRAADAEEEPPK